ncbi:hypothetical protein SAMN05443543_103156 [Flavobacterium flevense]|uniref:Uncharacterized protein n=1 Tax=Flavobacterium flevense TaxID=983 RepID=A0A4Y4AVR3_9FLAO|nr:hypothetical protein [Flavobacterium flevense]GEC70513.1 hypothetical protein FFL01_00520 [Flavobacterium flevense]SHL62488.1 hypothetical protein SAMN05443543_103156 [Flavobacterium flevense]
MKHFTEPNGKFIIELPNDWQYKNKIVSDEEISPFSFEKYGKSIGCFQISCYSSIEKEFSKIDAQKVDNGNLNFITARMDGGGFNMHLWYAVVDDHLFMIKYIYDTAKANSKIIKNELLKAEKALKTLELLGETNRKKALVLDKYEKFMSSLAASFDIKNQAFKKRSFIEFIIIVASQIDAYLRLCIVMKKQLNEKTDEIDIKYLSQSETDKPVMEKQIYKLSKELEIIDDNTYSKLFELYELRNKMVHRYIISEITTKEIHLLAFDYEEICEVVRINLKNVEETQAKEKIGIYKRGCPVNEDLPKEFINFLYSQVNDKHSLKNLYRKI